MIEPRENKRKEQVIIGILEKEKSKMIKDDLYINNENTIESYMKNSKMILEFIEKDILESLKNYFSRNELAILHEIVNRSKDHIIEYIFLSFTDKLKLNFFIFSAINTAEKSRYVIGYENKIDPQLITEIAIKIYQLKEYQILVLMHFLIIEPYNSMEAKKRVISKLISNK